MRRTWPRRSFHQVYYHNMLMNDKQLSYGPPQTPALGVWDTTLLDWLAADF